MPRQRLGLRRLVAGRLDRQLEHARDARARDVAGRQIQRELTAGADFALDPQLAAEQTRDLAADREPEPGPSVFAARPAVGLLEWLEDDPLLVARDPDSGVAHPEAD